ncbi:CapA family protein [Gluconacetobacter tumulicola]|uniref:CapA family protein n=1 Tax=Gluconacetobacter tumulicola TaxID=1017177 RepID=A0A7W4JCV1_9PROT|nr:CapA family protein [Gluconacetobacter tumulicola]MBB2178759.1 CapA family protein [Gluconacetobacter tumulicola]
MPTLALTGDSILLRRLNSMTDPAISPLFDLIRSSDIAFTNLEVLPNDFEGDPALESGGSHFGAPSWVIDELAEAGFDLFATATNHSLDYSISGLRKAIAALDARQILYAGIGETLTRARMPVYCTRPEGTVSLLSCTATFSTGQEAAAQTDAMQGRPGPNPLRHAAVYEVTPPQMATLREIAEQLGLESIRKTTIRLGFGFPPASEDILPLGGMNFRAAPAPRIRTTANAEDMADIARWVKEARLVSDLVVVSLHAHEVGYNAVGEMDPEIPAEFLVEFAHAAIDAGADLVAGHGPHLLRGIEIYRERPIFYSLGNFIGQNELVPRLPADSYRRFRASPDLTPAHVYRLRTEADTKGFPAESRFWETVMPVCEFGPGGVTSMTIHPVELGLGGPPHRRGVPRLATGEHASSILGRLQALSRSFGTHFEQEGDTLRWQIAKGTEHV